MKLTFWQRLLKALELYCALRVQDLGEEKADSLGIKVLDVDMVAEQLELDFPGVVYIKNSLNAQEFAKRYEVPDKVSMTIPDQTLSIRDIMRRFAAGLPIDGEKVPIYDGEDSDMPDLKNMDLAERQEYIETAKAELSDLNVKLEADRLKKAKKPEKESQKETKEEVPPVDRSGDDSKQFIG